MNRLVQGKKQGERKEEERGKEEKKARQTTVPYLPLIWGHEDLLVSPLTGRRGDNYNTFAARSVRPPWTVDVGGGAAGMGSPSFLTLTTPQTCQAPKSPHQHT